MMRTHASGQDIVGGTYSLQRIAVGGRLKQFAQIGREFEELVCAGIGHCSITEPQVEFDHRVDRQAGVWKRTEVVAECKQP